MSRPDRPSPVASVVIPAHDEERTIGRLLRALADPADGGDRLEVVVVCNGCTDRTAEVARRHGVLVRELSEPSKRAALQEGDRVASVFPRIYLDADVELTRAGAVRLAEAVSGGPVLAAGPRRVIPRRGAARLVRWYYDVWEALPAVRAGLFGRGVVALAEPGVHRVQQLPPTMGDDLAFSEAFTPAERTVVDDVAVVIHPPRTVRDLVRRRARVVTGNVQADREGIRSAGARTSLRALRDMAVSRPSVTLKIPVFVLVGALAQRRARPAVRAGDFTTWERDDSSRAVVPGAGEP